jgi:hypothetical protein
MPHVRGNGTRLSTPWPEPGKAKTSKKTAVNFEKKFAKYGNVLRFVNEVHFDTS